jgi:chaperonin GroES
MFLTSDNTFKKVVLVGDKVLIKPTTTNNDIDDLFSVPPDAPNMPNMPPNISSIPTMPFMQVLQGVIIKIGPGYIHSVNTEDESWKLAEEKVKYVPLQAKEGDIALFTLMGSFEVTYRKERYYIVPQNAILLLERDEEMN